MARSGTRPGEIQLLDTSCILTYPVVYNAEIGKWERINRR